MKQHGLWEFSVILLLSLVVIAMLALSVLDPVEPVPPAQVTFDLKRSYDYSALRDDEATVEPSRVEAEVLAGEWLDDGLLVTVSLSVSRANPLDLPPILRDGAGSVYEVDGTSLETARRTLPELVESGRAELELLFLDVTAPVEPLEMILNPGGSHTLAPKLVLSVPVPELETEEDDAS